jgi:hypothetical protein
MIVARHPAAAGLPGMCPKKGDPSRRDGMSRASDAFTAPGIRTFCRPNHTVPYGTEFVFRGYQALPTCYDHLVPLGQSPTAPFGTLHIGP